MEQARSFWLAAPGRGEIRTEPLRAPGPDEVLVRALRSGISRGTETLVFRGEVPADQHQAMRAPFQDGDFPGPVKYGYLSVGVVEDGPAELTGAAGLLPAPAPDRVRRTRRRRHPDPAVRPHRARRPGRHRRDRGQRGLGRRPADRRPDRRGRRRDGRLLHRPAARADPRHPGDPGRHRALAQGRSPRRSASTSPPRRTRPVVAISSCTPAPPRPGCSARSSCSRRRARCSTSAGTATAR